MTYIQYNKKVVNKGDRYGYLTIIEEDAMHISPSGRKERKFKCECECGKIVSVFLNNISKRARCSCGCHRSDPGRLAFTTHGLSKHPLHSKWLGIKARCYDTKLKRYNDYGGRGIKMCDEWKNDFQPFYEWSISNGYKEGLEIDRFPDNNGNYEPNNCRWATRIQNCNNRRSSNIYEYNGVKDTLRQFARMYNLKYGTFYNRVTFLGMTVKDAIELGSRRKIAIRKREKIYE